MDHPPQHHDVNRDITDGRVPLFGSWPRAYVAVVVAALVVMALVAVFSRWPF